MSIATAPAPLKLASWRTPVVLIAVGCAIALIAFGPRSALGQFLTPMSFDHGWGRETFSFAIAIQNLLWGAAQPFAGAIADRFGPVRVLSRRRDPLRHRPGLDGQRDTRSLTLDLSAGVMIGFGLAGCSFPMVIGALGKLVPENWRALRVRRRHRVGLVRAVPLFAAGAFADRGVLLADRAAGLRRHHAAGAAAVAGAGDAAGRAGRRRRQAAIVASRR